MILFFPVRGSINALRVCRITCDDGRALDIGTYPDTGSSSLRIFEGPDELGSVAMSGTGVIDWTDGHLSIDGRQMIELPGAVLKVEIPSFDPELLNFAEVT